MAKSEHDTDGESTTVVEWPMAKKKKVAELFFLSPLSSFKAHVDRFRRLGTVIMAKIEVCISTSIGASAGVSTLELALSCAEPRFLVR